LDVTRKRVLVVDSDAIVLALITHILTRQGYAVEPRAGYEEAIAAACAGAFDAAVVEVGASGDGTLLASLLERAPDLRGKVIVTGNETSDGLPVRERLERPIELGALVAAVHRCLGRAD